MVKEYYLDSDNLYMYIENKFAQISYAENNGAINSALITLRQLINTFNEFYIMGILPKTDYEIFIIYIKKCLFESDSQLTVLYPNEKSAFAIARNTGYQPNIPIEQM